MKQLLLAAIIPSLLGTFVPSPANAVGEAGAQFLKIPVGPKACAMGEAFVALADDPTAIYWNPAGLTRARSLRVMGIHVSWFEDMSCQHVFSTLETRHGHFGAALTYSSSGDIPGRGLDFRETGAYGAHDAAGTLAFAHQFAGRLSLGIGLKLIQQEIEEESATGYAADVGILCDPVTAPGLSLGLAVQNLGPEIKFLEEGDPLPLCLRGGLAYVRGPVSLVVDAQKPRFSEWRFHMGGEFVLANTLALRGGYKTRPELENSLTVGVGVSRHNLRIEYAYLPNEEIQDTHHFALTVEL